MALGVCLQRTQLIVEDLLCLPEQAADKRAFAIIDATAGDKTQQVLIGLLLEPFAQCCRLVGVLFGRGAFLEVCHQK